MGTGVYPARVHCRHSTGQRNQAATSLLPGARSQLWGTAGGLPDPAANATGPGGRQPPVPVAGNHHGPLRCNPPVLAAVHQRAAGPPWRIPAAVPDDVRYSPGAVPDTGPGGDGQQQTVSTEPTGAGLVCPAAPAAAGFADGCLYPGRRPTGTDCRRRARVSGAGISRLLCRRYPRGRSRHPGQREHLVTESRLRNTTARYGDAPAIFRSLSQRPHCRGHGAGNPVRQLHCGGKPATATLAKLRAAVTAIAAGSPEPAVSGGALIYGCCGRVVTGTGHYRGYRRQLQPVWSRTSEPGSVHLGSDGPVADIHRPLHCRPLGRCRSGLLAAACDALTGFRSLVQECPAGLATGPGVRPDPGTPPAAASRTCPGATAR